MTTIIKYASSQISNVLGSNFSPFLVITFKSVKNIVINARKPIASEDITVDAKITASIDMKISLSMFCKNKLFSYKYCNLFCVKFKILLNIITMIHHFRTAGAYLKIGNSPVKFVIFPLKSDRQAYFYFISADNSPILCNFSRICQ